MRGSSPVAVVTLTWLQLSLVAGGEAPRFWARVSQTDPWRSGSIKRTAVTLSERRGGRLWWEAPTVLEAPVLVVLAVVLLTAGVVLVSPCYTTCPLTSCRCLPPTLFFSSHRARRWGRFWWTVTMATSIGVAGGGRAWHHLAIAHSVQWDLAKTSQVGRSRCCCLSVTEIFAVFLFVFFLGER